MNIFQGTMYVVDSERVILGCINAAPYLNHVVLNVSENKDEDISQSPYLQGIVQDSTILCPPPSAVYMEIDGNTNGFIDCYREYLYSPEVRSFILMALFGMYRGMRLYLYLPEFTNESIWIGVLIGHLKDVYGIDVGLIGKKFAFDDQYSEDILCEWYARNFIDVFEFISYFNPMGRFGYKVQPLGGKIIMDLIPFGFENVQDPFKFIKSCKEDQARAMQMTGTVGRLIPGISFV